MTITLYSQYFNNSISRRLGRRVSRNAAKNFSESKLDELLRSINAKFEVRPAKYPRAPWLSGNIYVVESSLKKSTIIKMLERKLL
ncbi:MAG: signal recognition particle [Thermoplasmatales archaeon B_DKE]|nr:MAG: signal recognition particle [Thermoplasmatales archaeon B_DKE]